MQLAILLAAVASLLYVGLRHWVRLRYVFGFSNGAGREVLAGAGVGFGPVLLAWALLWAAGQIDVERVPFDGPGAARGLIELAGFAALEELLFRVGLLLALLHLTGRVWLAVGVQLVLFGLVHAENPSANALTVVSNGIGGLVYAVAFLRSGRFWLPWTLHTFWNWTQGLLGFSISGTGRYADVLVRLTPTGPDWLSGGGYGLEGSVVGIAARFGVLVLTWWLTGRFRRNSRVSIGSAWPCFPDPL